MTKKVLNQNMKLYRDFIEIIEPNFSFGNKPIDRFEAILKDNTGNKEDKIIQLLNLKKQINSIENCSLKNNSKNIVFGKGEISSPLMLIGETPGIDEDNLSLPFQGKIGALLDKMLLAINIKRPNVYTTYSINFRPPEDRKPNSNEIARYSSFLKEHISIIDPKIIILMGSTAMEAVTGLKTKVSSERGSWKEVILKNKTYPLMVTFSPSYLIRFPENKKYSWEDLKKIREKIENLNIQI